MVDLTKTIAPKSDQLNADDLIGCTKTIKITGIKLMGEPDQPIAINFEGDNGKPYKPCKSMRRLLVQVWGGDGNAYIGRSLTLYRDEKVKFGGADVGGIRISHMSHINAPTTVALTVTKSVRKPFVVQPLQVAAPIAHAAPETIEAGDLAAKSGVANYTAWLATLTPEVKATIRPFHGKWSAIAKDADAPKPEDDAEDNMF